MKKQLSFKLATMLLMFPQIVETIYSPALTHIAQGFSVSPELSGQTLSLYFIAFAVGVIIWGRLCDIIGRKKALLAGLTTYAIASFMAISCHDFHDLLMTRMLAAFGAAVGSIGTQTAMRDCFDAAQLNRVFSIMGIAIAMSPAIGVLAGSFIVHHYGYQGVFYSLAGIALFLFGYTVSQMPETMPKNLTHISLNKAIKTMLSDREIWHSAFFIALFNISLFSYYQLAPFMFDALGIDSVIFGYSGIIIALGVTLGSLLNRYMVKRQLSFHSILGVSIVLHVLGSMTTYLLDGRILFMVPITLVVMSYGVAIPNLLARALRNYKHYAGTAGAILGLVYYTMLGLGLIFAGFVQNLSVVLCAVSAGILCNFMISACLGMKKQSLKIESHS